MKTEASRMNPRKGKRGQLNRRDFIYTTVLTGSSAMIWSCGPRSDDLTFGPAETLGGILSEDAPVPIPGATWYTVNQVGEGLSYFFPAGLLSRAVMITCDMLLDGNHMIVFGLELQEGENGPIFRFRFSGLNQCSFRVRMPLSLVDQNRWGIDREAAFLKPRCGSDRVDLARVDRLRLTVTRKSPNPARWCMTPLRPVQAEVERISEPILPKGPLLDELGQSTLHEWPAKSRSVDEVTTRIRAQFEASGRQAWPAEFSRWGGWKGKRLDKAPGFFRTHHDGSRWWLMDPDGYAFWSAGLDCVRVDTYAKYDGLESALAWIPSSDSEFQEALEFGSDYRRGGKFINYLTANLIRAFGPDGWREKWAQIALAELRRLRFNTVGNWSEWTFAKAARIPYVRPMSFNPERAGNIYRDFPDVFHPAFEQDAVDFAAQLEETRDDPAFLGYFLMNEPTWGFSSELPAVGMLFTSPVCEARKALSGFLREKYGESSALARAWGLDATLEEVASGSWTKTISDAARSDLEEFSTVMVTRYFKVLSDACRAVDPNHLNLGMRWAGLPPLWAVQGMKAFDVYSINCYREKVPSDVTQQIQDLLSLPTIIGEWHFGALDVGLPSSGIGHLKNQQDRGRAYRVYLEDAAANPNCVGAHWFTLYDESALGRFDGENYNIGFLDVCNRPYEELCAAAIASHERLYTVATTELQPFDEAPEYLLNLY